MKGCLGQWNLGGLPVPGESRDRQDRQDQQDHEALRVRSGHPAELAHTGPEGKLDRKVTQEPGRLKGRPPMGSRADKVRREHRVRRAGLAGSQQNA